MQWETAGFLTGITIALVGLAGYLTHLLWAFELLMNTPDPTPWGRLVLAAIGSVMLPIGSLHGIYLWFV